MFDKAIQQFEALCERAQDMMVRLVTVEVEAHLREHLKRYVGLAPVSILGAQRWSFNRGRHPRTAFPALGTATKSPIILSFLN